MINLIYITNLISEIMRGYNPKIQTYELLPMRMMSTNQKNLMSWIIITIIFTFAYKI